MSGVVNSHERATRRRRAHLTVALVGADGAGKSTISRLLREMELPAPVKTVYMGVNLEASSLMLPTTRLLLTAKRVRGGRPDLVASRLQPDTETAPPAVQRGWRQPARDAARLSVWMLEEWLRQLVAVSYAARGYIVVFDRHFFADYYFTDIVAGATGRGVFARLHGWMLAHAYPKPDLVICLDAPAEVLYLRKPESSVDWLEQRRQQYLRLAEVVPAFEVVNVDRPLEVVAADVVDRIRAHWEVSST